MRISSCLCRWRPELLSGEGWGLCHGGCKVQAAWTLGSALVGGPCVRAAGMLHSMAWAGAAPRLGQAFESWGSLHSSPGTLSLDQYHTVVDAHCHGFVKLVQVPPKHLTLISSPFLRTQSKIPLQQEPETEG